MRNDIPSPSFILSGGDFAKWAGTMVYAWKRGADYLYVGCSSYGLSRTLKHNIINRAEQVLPGDIIEGWFCNSWEEATIFETKLKIAYNPPYSPVLPRWHGVGPRPLTRRVCPSCKTEFPQNRSWQIYCSTPCRMGIG